MNTVNYNRKAWNKESNSGCRWSIPVDVKTIEAARKGDWNVILTPNKQVPRDWFGELNGKTVLCLASGGGQQVPILAAAGAIVTSFDNSDEQLAKDQLVANRDGLELITIQGDMADLSVFNDNQFDLIFHPCSNTFVENVRPVWREAFRVLKDGGRLLSGFLNPVYFMFDHDEAEEKGLLEVKYSLPYSDLTSLPVEQREEIFNDGSSLTFGHTLDDQIGGQIAEGFSIAGFYEDDWNDEATPLNKYMKVAISTLAIKLG